VWKDARILIRNVRLLCKKAHANHDFAFIDQITRAARSVAANIAEGAEDSYNAQFVVFLGYAKRSAGEVRAHLYDALDEGYINQSTFDSLAHDTVRLCAKIGAFMKYLKQSSSDSRNS
jgi:four helix bundle protein